MKKQTRSILQELSSFANSRDIEYVIESRALHVINSAINILETTRKAFPEDVALDLERRLLNSIRTGEPDKFRRGIKRIIESKHSSSRLAKLETTQDIDQDIDENSQE